MQKRGCHFAFVAPLGAGVGVVKNVGAWLRAISVQKCSEIRPQSTPEAVDEAIALNKYARAYSEVEKACCEAWGVDFDDV